MTMKNHLCGRLHPWLKTTPPTAGEEQGWASVRRPGQWPSPEPTPDFSCCVCVRAHARVCACMYMCVHVCVHVCACACVLCVCMCTRVCVHVCRRLYCSCTCASRATSRNKLINGETTETQLVSWVQNFRALRLHLLLSFMMSRSHVTPASGWLHWVH